MKMIVIFVGIYYNLKIAGRKNRSEREAGFCPDEKRTMDYEISK